MASEEYQEQPKANQSSSISEEAESFTPQKIELSHHADDADKVDSQTQLSLETESARSISAAEGTKPIDRKIIVTESIPPKLTEPKEGNSARFFIDENSNWWDEIINKVRSILPESVNKSLSDWVLTGIISSLIVLILSLAVILLPSRASALEENLSQSSYVPQKSLEMTSISKTDITENSPPATEKEEVKTVSQSAEITSLPKPEPAISEDSPPIKEKELNKTIKPPVEMTSTTSETKIVPKKDKNSKAKTPLPPKPILTPEQSLFSVVQDKVSKITSQYSNQLIVSGEADLLGSRLLIRVSDDWYQLNKSRQDEFANGTLKSSQKFNFNKLEIQDVQNNLIARSPVVGNKMIILQRTD